MTQPQACYAAYTFGLKHRWTYFLRTLLDIQDLPDPLENAISQVLIPAITERKCNQLDRDILALPVRLGGLCLGNPCLEAGQEYTDESLVNSAQQAVKYGRAEDLKDMAERIREIALTKTRWALDLTAEKGSSVWLTVLPLREMGFNLNKWEFRDLSNYSDHVCMRGSLYDRPCH